MSTIEIRNLGYYSESGCDHRKKPLAIKVPMIGTVRDVYRDFTADIISARVTCINGHLGDGAGGISYTLTGNVDYGNGEISLESRRLSRENLAKIGVFLWHDYSGWYKKTVGKQMTEALAIENSYGFTNTEQILKLLQLPAGVLDRPLHYLSHKRWPATIAIGLAKGKRIFGFPWLNPNYIRAYRGAWLGHSLQILKELNAWIVIPTADPTSLDGHVEDILYVKGPFHLGN